MDYKEMPQLGDLNIPYYVQIYDIIYQLIQDEKLKEGDSLPGENILAEYWNVSRSTVRMAVRKLEEDGYIYKMQGKKTTVTGSWPEQGWTAAYYQPMPCSCVDAMAGGGSHQRQNGGRLLAICWDITVNTAAAVDMKYFVGDLTWRSVAIILCCFWKKRK
ncbi:GntR family transcriptional regulator [Enterocloster sp.]|uniref:GntR family transcriptional regulator n=1 Tax=Enterocloster sp. TaxID=2719315 RepID=UPI00399FDC6A